MCGVVTAHHIPASLIINSIKTLIDLAPKMNWTMCSCGSQRIEVTSLNDKRQVAATLAVTLEGKFLPFQIIYQGKSERFNPPFDIYHTPYHWASGETVVQNLIDDALHRRYSHLLISKL